MFSIICTAVGCLLGKLSCLLILAEKMVNSDLIFPKFLFFSDVNIVLVLSGKNYINFIKCCQLLSVGQIDPIS